MGSSGATNMKAISVASRSAVVPDFLQLTKPRITILVVATTLVGFYLGSSNPVPIWLLLNTLLGTALTAAGASALNMAMEWEPDSRMKRTEKRPIPAGRISVLHSALFGSILCLIGSLYLLLVVNPLTSALSALTALLYLFAYTPLKKRTSLCTVVGAIPGAIPPMMGWTAVRNSMDFEAWWLFAILFVWQLPHFLSIAWLYREDYARGGFPMLPVIDQDGHITSRHILVETLALLCITLTPLSLGVFHQAYFVGALLLGSGFFYMGLNLARTKSLGSARRLLLTSVFYLPCLLILMMLAKI
jgi:protoheme IX farnesyltransferase